MTLDLGITRRQRYVSNVTAANITTSTYAQGGIITSYTYSGTTYIAHIFTASGIFTVTSTIYPLEVLAVAGGGGGGQSSNSSAGGGGGGGIVQGGSLVTINRAYASSAFIAVTTSTQANVVGGWVEGLGQTDFTGGNGSFLYSWNAVQQTAGGARTMPIMDAGAYNNLAPQNYYMEIGITYTNPGNVGIGLIRDGYPTSGYNNVPYINLSTGVVSGFLGTNNTLGAFLPGDTLQIAWSNVNAVTGGGTYWWVGRNNNWNANTVFDTATAGVNTGTYRIGELRLIFMCTSSGGGTVRGQFRSGLENKFAPPISNTIPGFTLTNYTGYYTNPLGTGYITSGNNFGVTIGAGGGVGSFNPTTSASANGNNGGDTIIYNANNASSYYSAYFASGIITATNSAFSFGTNDFSIETWMYPTSSYGRNATYNYRPIFDSRDFNNRGGDVPNRGFIVYLGLYNNVGIYTSGTTYLTTVNTVTNAAWSHVAVARINGVMNVWINGKKDNAVFVTTATTAFHNFTNTNIRIGYGSISQDWSISSFYTGYLSNYRIVNGISAYHNPGIIGLTAPLTATQNANVKGTPSAAISGTSTSLLMLTTSTGAGAFYDSSLGTTATLTNNGVVTASGLGPGTYSGSLSFNGTSQYLSNVGSTAFTFGTGDFTVEYWVYYNALTAGTTYFICGNGRSGNGYFFGSFGFIPYMSTSAVGYQATTAGTFKLQQWTHVAWARSGSTINLYINGSWTYAYYNMVDNITETGFSIGARTDPAFFVNAYISNIRVVKGVALYTYTGNFTPPTTLTSATQSAALFYPGPANLPSVLAVNTITTQTVLLAFNTATIGNASTLTIALNQTSGTVTVSTFAPFTTSTEIIRAFGGGGGAGNYQQNGASGGSGGGASGNGWGGTPVPGQGKAGGQGSQSLGSGGGGYSTTGGPGLNEGTWPVAGNPAGAGGDGGYFNHSGVMTAYSGGGGGGSWVNSLWTVGLGGVGGGGNGAYYAPVTGALMVATSGAINSGGGGGAAGNTSAPNYNAAPGGSGIVIFRYPAFLGDAARFPTELTDPYLKNTTLLLSGQFVTTATNNSTIKDSSNNNISIITATNTIAQGPFSPYGSLWSTSFNGVTDYISFVSTVTTGTAFQQNIFWGANKSFTIEAWLNPNATQLSSTATVILGDVQPTSSGLAWSVGVDSSNKPMMYWKDPVNGNNFLTATTTLSTGTWNHVAWVSNAGTATIFINGSNQFLTTSTISTLTNTTQTFGIVSGAYFNKFYNGSISNLKVSKTALYSPNLNLGSSGYFNGSSYLTSATSTAMVFGTNNFTVEFWVLWITVGGAGSYNQVVGKVSSANSVGFGAGSGRWYMTTSVAGFDSGVTINTNQWYHVAWVRNSGSVTLYLNGVSSYTTAFATSINDTGFDIGGSSLSGIQYSNVLVSNIRIVNGTAVYTSNFTVPTPNLSNITNTRLLTFFTTGTTFTDYSSTPTILTSSGNPSFLPFTPVLNASFTLPTTPFNASANTILLIDNTYRHIDSSTSSFALNTGTATSIPRIQKYSPYSSGYPYTPISIGSSALFNGTSDYLYTNTSTNITLLTLNGTTQYLTVSAVDSGPLDLATGAPDWTVECWFYPTSVAGSGSVIWKGGGSGINPSYAMWLNGATPQVIVGDGSTSGTAFSLTNVSINTWYHFALVRNGGWITAFLNGVSATPVALTFTMGATPSSTLYIGAAFDGRFFPGAISNVRIVKGTAVYATNTNFTPPTTDLTAIPNTQFLTLLSTTSTTITDYSTNTLTISLVGSPVLAVSTLLPPITTSSFSTIPLQLDSDFTVECWVYTTSTAAQCIFDFAGKEGNTLRPTSFALNMAATSGLLSFSYNNTTSPNSTAGVIPFTWTHIAVTRISGFMSIYQNGLSTLIVSTSTNYSNGQLIIGRNGPTVASYFSGYISDFRIIKGQSIYTANFNPPVAPLKIINSTTSTSLLLNFNNAAIVDSTMQNNVRILNSATITSAVTKYNARSMYFSGITDFITAIPVSTSSYALGTSDFTVEMWVYILPVTIWAGVNNLQPTTFRSIFDMRTQNTANFGFDIYLGNTGTINVGTLNLDYIRGTTLVSVSTWHHVALVRRSNVFNLYLNGFTEGTPYSSATPNFINPTVRIGFGAQTNYFNGYIDDVRVTRGVARYTTSTFIVPQKSLPVK